MVQIQSGYADFDSDGFADNNTGVSFCGSLPSDYVSSSGSQHNGALNFAGNAGSYVSIPNINNFPSTAMTLEMWVKVNTPQNGQTLFSYFNDVINMEYTNLHFQFIGDNLIILTSNTVMEIFIILL